MELDGTPGDDAVAVHETAEMVRERAAIQERQEARQDARKMRNITIMVAVLGVVATIAATLSTGANQSSQAREGFLRQERKAAYADYVSRVSSLQYAVGTFELDPALRKPLNEKSYKLATTKFFKILGDQYLSYQRSAAVVDMIGSRPYRDKADGCQKAIRKWVDDMAQEVDDAFAKRRPYNDDNVREFSRTACHGLNRIAQRDLSKG